MTTPCANFASEISVVGTDCVIANITGDGSCDTPYVISISEAVSADVNNAIECRPDGLYASPEVLCYHINFSIAGGISLTNNTSQIFEPITAGSSLTFKTPYLDTPSSSGSVVYALKTSGGATIATATFLQGANTGTWSVPSYVMPSTLLISGEVTSTGLGASGLSAPMMVCEPDSAFADPGAFYDNVDPVQICAMIAANCNATLSVIGGNTLQFTANDGSVTNIDFTTLIDVCQQVADNCNATLVNNGDGTVTFTDNAGAVTVVSLATSSVSSDAGNVATIGTDSGIYVPSRTATTAWPYSGAITTGQPVWLGLDNKLYSVPKEFKATFYQEDVATHGSGTYTAGTTLREFLYMIGNNDTSGRVMQGTVHFFWRGLAVYLGGPAANAEITVNYQVRIGGVWTSVSTYRVKEFGATTPVLNYLPGFTFPYVTTIPASTSMGFGIRYQIVAATLATYSANDHLYTSISGEFSTIS